MSITLYDLTGAEDDRRFSPYCWRIHMALLHKGLDFRTVPWRFTEKDEIAFSGQGKVPVIVDDGRVVADSWAIAEYLDETYADRPSLFGGPVAKGLARFATDWTEQVVQGGIFRLIANDLFAHIAERDKAYFRTSREERFGMTIEALGADREARLPAFQASLAPARATLAQQPFLSGNTPAWADYALFGAFQWARAVSPYHLLAEDDPVHAWRQRLLDAFGGAAGRALGYAV